jgi:hypothetical protein
MESVRMALGRVEWDVAVMSESAAPFVRYFLSMTPPLPSGMEVERALGRKQFSMILDQIAERMRTDGRLTAETIERLAKADRVRVMVTLRAILAPIFGEPGKGIRRAIKRPRTRHATGAQVHSADRSGKGRTLRKCGTGFGGARFLALDRLPVSTGTLLHAEARPKLTRTRPLSSSQMGSASGR